MAHTHFDLAVAGGGICGLAVARAAVRRGRSVVVFERDAAANGASIRNFGFVTVTGQEPLRTWARARRTAALWAEIAEETGLAVHQRGCAYLARTAEGADVLAEFHSGPMGAACELLTGAALRARLPAAAADTRAGLFSPHELRLEPRAAIAALTAALAREAQVAFRFATAVTAATVPEIATSRGSVRADALAVCPGPDLVSLMPEAIAAHGVTLTRLQMLAVACPGLVLPCPVLGDLSLVRYQGFRDCPSLETLRARMAREAGQLLAEGIHLIAVQNTDGTLVVGDSHHDGEPPDPAMPARVEAAILSLLADTLTLPARPEVTARWQGVYPVAAAPALIAAPSDRVRLLMVTSGTGMSTALALGEEVADSLWGPE